VTSARPATLIADGRIATTQIVARLLQACYGEVRIAASDDLPVPLASGPLVVSRLAEPPMSWLPDYFRERGRPYVYFLDDNFFELGAHIDPRNGPYYQHPAVRDALDRFLRGATLVWLMSGTLRAYLADRLPGLPTLLTHAPIDLATWDAAPAGAPPPLPGHGATFRVGYPSAPRENMAWLLTEIVARCGARFGGSVGFEFVGWWPAAVQDAPNVRCFPARPDYRDYAAFVKSRRWDCAIAPLADSLFENCKTDNKFRDYAAAGVAGIYSRTSLYRSSVVDGETGLLVENDAAAWVDAIASLRDAAGLRAAIANAAYDTVRARNDQAIVARAVVEGFARAGVEGLA
jgi:glycosyltransferase involved in cell wall biosynthesis